MQTTMQCDFGNKDLVFLQTLARPIDLAEGATEKVRGVLYSLMTAPGQLESKFTRAF